MDVGRGSVAAHTLSRRGHPLERQFYLDLAASGLRMPIGTDLVLREKPDHDAILLDGERLGKVVEESARRYGTPLAVPLMDLTVEKEAMLLALGVPAPEVAQHHFHSAPSEADMAAVEAAMDASPTPRMRANLDAIRYVAANTDLVPCGMSIGPFSLMTKLIADPIAPVYMLGAGVTGEDDPEVKAVEAALEIATRTVLHSVRSQIEAGAKVMIVCEPAANRIYLSPKQIGGPNDIFERLVMGPNRRIVAVLEAHGVDLFFHDCGELLDAMVERIATLRPVILSLGSSRNLWEDAARVPKDVVLYGNLPTKKFFSKDLTPGEVEAMACDLLRRMKETGHPFILGSECDVLSVPDSHEEIAGKVRTFMTCACS